MRPALRFVVVVVSALILAQFEVGFYGLWQNLWLMSIVTSAAFMLGWIEWEI